MRRNSARSPSEWDVWLWGEQVSEVKPIEDVDVNEHEGVDEAKTGDVERDCTMERRGSCTEGAGVLHSGVNDGNQV